MPSSIYPFLAWLANTEFSQMMVGSNDGGLF